MTHTKDTTQKESSSRGYALLFTVLLVAIILSITIGIADVAYKEFDLNVTAQNSYLSFFAADSAGECALYGVRHGTWLQDQTLTCDSATFPAPTSTVASDGGNEYDYPNITVQNACADVSIDLLTNSNTQQQSATIVSRGYDVSCANLALSTKIERDLSYSFTFASNNNNSNGGGGNGGGTGNGTGGGTGGSSGTGTGGGTGGTTGGGTGGTTGGTIGPPNNGTGG